MENCKTLEIYLSQPLKEKIEKLEEVILGLTDVHRNGNRLLDGSQNGRECDYYMENLEEQSALKMAETLSYLKGCMTKIY